MRGLTRRGCESFFHTGNEGPSELGERRINPASLIFDIKKLNHASNNLTIRHVLKIDSLSSLVLTEPDLVEVSVKLLDDVVAVLLQLNNSLLLGQAEYLLVHLSPE